MFLIIGTVRHKRVEDSMGKDKDKEDEDLSGIKRERERGKQQEFVLLKLQKPRQSVRHLVPCQISRHSHFC